MGVVVAYSSFGADNTLSNSKGQGKTYIKMKKKVSVYHNLHEISSTIGETTPTLVRSNLNWKLHHPVSIMASKKDLSLLQHPLTKAWLKYKWNAYALWIFLILLAIRAFSIAMLVPLLNTIRLV